MDLFLANVTVQSWPSSEPHSSQLGQVTIRHWTEQTQVDTEVQTADHPRVLCNSRKTSPPRLVPLCPKCCVLSRSVARPSTGPALSLTGAAVQRGHTNIVIQSWGDRHHRHGHPPPRHLPPSHGPPLPRLLSQGVRLWWLQSGGRLYQVSVRGQNTMRYNFPILKTR